MRKEYIALRDQALQRLGSTSGVTCQKPEGAFYLYPNISRFLGRGGPRSPADLARKLLLEAHLATVPGEGFGTDEHIRISYATSASELDRGLKRLRDFLSSL
jgi:aspartate aminotransferase